MHVRRQGKCSSRHDRVDKQVGVAATCRRAVDQLTCAVASGCSTGTRPNVRREQDRQPSCSRTHQEIVSARKRHGSWTFSTLGSAGCLSPGRGRFVAESRCCWRSLSHAHLPRPPDTVRAARTLGCSVERSRRRCSFRPGGSRRRVHLHRQEWSEAERLTSAQLADDDRARLRRIVGVGRQ
jgi:hypothetical protein